MKKTLGLSLVGLGCWTVMFFAGTDVWHFAGSPDFWSLNGPPNSDLRVFGYAFYLQFFILLGLVAFGIASAVRSARAEGAN